MVPGRACAHRFRDHQRDPDRTASAGGNRHRPGHIGGSGRAAGDRHLCGVGDHRSVGRSAFRLARSTARGDSLPGGSVGIRAGVGVRAEFRNPGGAADPDRHGRGSDSPQHHWVGVGRDFASQAGPGRERAAVDPRSGGSHQRAAGRGAGRCGRLAVCVHPVRQRVGRSAGGELPLAAQGAGTAGPQLRVLLQVQGAGVAAVLPRGGGGERVTAHRLLGEYQFLRGLPDKYF